MGDLHDHQNPRLSCGGGMLTAHRRNVKLCLTHYGEAELTAYSLTRTIAAKMIARYHIE
jgi:hypothetical protein